MAEKRKSYSASSSHPAPHAHPPRTQDERSKAEEPRVQVAVDAPVQWYYNDDHTDPVNFGFMFPVRNEDVDKILRTNNIQKTLEATVPNQRARVGSTQSGHVPPSISSRTSQISPQSTVGGLQYDQPQWSSWPEGHGSRNQYPKTQSQLTPPHISPQESTGRSIPYRKSSQQVTPPIVPHRITPPQDTYWLVVDVRRAECD